MADKKKSAVRRDIDRAIRDERVLREITSIRGIDLNDRQTRNFRIVDALRKAHRHGRPQTPAEKKRWKRTPKAEPHWDEYGYDDDLPK